MSTIREKLTNMFSKVMAGTVTREEGAMLINHLVKEDQAETVKELARMIDIPPQGVFQKTVLHTIALSRNKSFLNLFTSCLGHKNEDVAILAAEELARLKTAEAKDVLVEHLNNDAYHVRKASAMALVKGFADGVDIVKGHLLRHQEPFYRRTSAQVLFGSGRKGVEALLSVLTSNETGAMVSAAEAIVSGGGELEQVDIPRVFDALMTAGDRKDSQSIIELLKVAGSLRGRASGFEGFVLAFADYPVEPVRKEAENALRLIRS